MKKFTQTYEEFVNENLNEAEDYPNYVKAYNSKTPRPSTLTTKKKVAKVMQPTFVALEKAGYKKYKEIQTGSSYMLFLLLGDKNYQRGFAETFKKNLKVEDTGNKVSLYEFKIKKDIYVIALSEVKTSYGLETRKTVWMKNEIKELAPAKKVELVPMWAIVKTSNPLATRDRGYDYAWCKSDGEDQPLMTMKEFRAMAKRVAYSFAEKNYIQHDGGTVHKIYKDKNKFIQDYKKLTRNTPDA